MADMKNELEMLRSELQDKTRRISELEVALNEKDNNKWSYPEVVSQPYDTLPKLSMDKLSIEAIARNSRQLILPEFGVKGQLKLCQSSALIVGCGGLGCPSALYLAAAGIGRIGLVDYDEVELNNLHRQILHTETSVGVKKSASAASACNRLNSKVDCVPYHLLLNPENAIKIIEQYDIVLDCTDNVVTRYLLNDACILSGKPLVSGSALRFEGQLTVYNYRGGPCYRCLYPKPPPPETVTNCSDGGVLGVIPGIIGCLQALEAIKILGGMESSFGQKLLMFDGLEGTFRSIKLRGRQPKCSVCGNEPTITKLIDYEAFCGSKPDDKCKTVRLLKPGDRITAQEYESIVKEDLPHVLVDVREPVELEICSLKNPINIPIGQVKDDAHIKALEECVEAVKYDDVEVPIYVVCRRGNDSQLAVAALREKLKGKDLMIKDIKGGLYAWQNHVDKSFPLY